MTEKHVNEYQRNSYPIEQVEFTFRDTEERLRLAVASTNLGTWDFNPQTGELTWDERCKAMFGLPDDAAVDYEVFLAGLHPDDRAQTDAIVQRALNPDFSGEYDIEYRTIGITDGVERWIAAKGRAFFDDTGKAYRFIGTVLDITERKRTEAEREQLLQREQAARAEAEATNRIRDEFLAVLSHELRSPLNPILGWARLLQSHTLDATIVQKALETIERNAKLQAQLIEDLLDISRILQGKLPLTRAVVSLVSTIEAALETVHLAAEAKAIDVQMSLDPANQPVLGDAARLQQVFWNLLSNAVKFTPPHGQVCVRLTYCSEYAHITVSDTGKGIDTAFLPYVFDYFRQADSTTTRTYGGLGLGLAIVRHLVEMHGGSVQAESLGEDQGATFTVRLPLLKVEDFPPQTDSEDDSAVALDTSPLAGLQILVVDDDTDSRDLLTFLLEQFGAIVLTAASAGEALQLLAHTEQDVLLSDIAMPEIDGYMLLRLVRILETEQGRQQVPAIALTAYAGDVNQQQALAAGFQRHLAKPIAPEELVQEIMSLVHS